MHYLITGGCGFIGAHLARHLLACGHRITVLDNLSTGKKERLTQQDIRLIEGDITTPGIFDALVSEMDGCFHLAAISSVAQSKERWLATHRINLGGTVALLEAIARSGRKLPVVYASSAAVYGNTPDHPQSVASPCLPRSGYGVDKYACEMQASIASSIHGIPSIGFRMFNVYGEGQDPHSPYSGVISIFGGRMKLGQEIVIFGDGKQQRDFMYVRDTVRGLDAGMQALLSGMAGASIFNLGSGKVTSIQELAELIAKLTGSRSAITYGPAKDEDIRYSCSDMRLTQEILDFSAQTSLEDGLRKTLESL